MKVAVIGAGAVGGAIGAVLHRAGHQVEVTARGEHLRAIHTHGLHLTGQWGEYLAAVDAHDTLTRAPELVIVATKALDAANALRDNASWLHGVPIVVIQNGIEALSTAKNALPHNDVVGGLALFAASLVAPGQVAITTSGSTYLGGTGSMLSVEYAAAALCPVIPVRVTRNFAGAQWTKLIVNQINALPAITGTSAQATITDRGLRKILTLSMREAVSIALGSGVHFEKMQGLSHGLLRLFHRTPLALAQLLPLVIKWRMGSTPNPGSTLQSIRRGQKSEVDFLNGAIVDAAHRSGKSAPLNATLVDLVHEVESTGNFFTPSEVISRVNSAIHPPRGMI